MLTDFLREIKKFFTWWVVVLPWEQAVRVRLGKHVRLLDAGVYFYIPLLDRVFVQSTRLRTADLRPQTITTLDGALVTVAGNVKFTVCDIQQLFETLHNPNETIVDFVASEIANAVRQTEKDDCSPDQVEQQVNNAIMFEEYGLSNVRVYITDFAITKAYRLLMDRISDIRYGYDYGLNTQNATGGAE